MKWSRAKMLKEQFLLGDSNLVRKVCHICFRETYCRPLKVKSQRKRNVYWLCTRCLPISNEVVFNDEYIVLRRKNLEKLYKAIHYLVSALMKAGIILYAHEKKGKIQKTEETLKVGFVEDKKSKKGHTK